MLAPVTQDGDDERLRVIELPGRLHGSVNDETRGASHEETLLAGEPPGHEEGIPVTHRHVVVHEVEREGRRNLVVPEAFDLVRLPLDESTCVEEGRDHRAYGIDSDDLHLRIALLQKFCGTGDRAARSGTSEQVREAAPCLLPELGSGALVVRLRVGGRGELIGQHCTRRVAGDLLGFLQVVLRMIGWHRGRRDDHVRTEGAKQLHFLLTHLVGHREDAVVALCRGRHCQGDARVPGRGLDDGAARP